MTTVRSAVRNGRIEVSDAIHLPEGCEVLVMLLTDSAGEFWMDASRRSLAEVWDNTEDDAYAQLLHE
jgi:hypothetical protein